MRMRPIMKEGTRILRPSEYEMLMDAMSGRKNKYNYREIVSALLFTGMRYAEFERFAKHKEWFDKRTMSIYLPREASRKKERKMKDRYVHLSSQGVIHVEYFVRYVDAVPRRETMNNVLRIWGKKTGIMPLTVKTFRKTWESWLVVSYPEMIPVIAMSQGHTTLTAMHHYLNLPFTKDEIESIKVMTAGWAGIKSEV